LGFITACAEAQAQGNGLLRFQTSQPGVAVFNGSVDVDGRAVSLFAVRVSLRTHRLEIGIPEGNQAGDTLVGFQSRYRPIAVLSGGFLKSFYPPTPLGMVKHGGIALNRGIKGEPLTGVLLATRNRVAILPYADNRCDSTWSECLQAGPLLVDHGTPALPSPETIHLKSTRTLIDEKFTRAFVAVLPDGEVVLGIIGEVSLPALQDFLLRSKHRGGLGCTGAINLSGSVSAGLLVNAAGRPSSKGSTDIFLANSIVIR
jgi:hypothetical protein